MSRPDRLYGTPEAERLEDDPAAVWEVEIEPLREHGEDGPWIVEEHTVMDPLAAIMPAERIVKTVAEFLLDDYGAEGYGAEGDVFHGDPWKDPELLAATEVLRGLIAARVRYHWAGEKVAEHTITLVDGEPWLDGEPMYRPAVSS